MDFWIRGLEGYKRVSKLVSPYMMLTTAEYKTWVFVGLIATYLLLVRSLRYRRVERLQHKYGFRTRESMSTMTDTQAWEIISHFAELEFPAMFEKGLQFALFRTYAIPSISKLLVKTTQLSASRTVGKRYADTAVLVAEIFGNAPSDPRSIEAFARLNYIHGVYIQAGEISNDDMLYTLALFMCEPVRWISRADWRRMTDMEVCAMGTFHKSMGDAMLIKYDVLPSAKNGWRDGLHFYEELEAWSVRYETVKMVPHQGNYDTAIQTQKLLLSTMPGFVSGAAANVLSAAMDDRLRRAIKFNEPTPIYKTLINSFLTVRGYILRHLSLPRPNFLRSRLVDDKADAHGRRTFTRYDNLPYYVRPTFWNRCGPGAWGSRLMGLPLPGDKDYLPEGYLTGTVGPKAFESKGGKEAELTKVRLRTERSGGCPFATGRERRA